ncbi:MAG: DMT family transporter [Bacteroidota bacterium]
MPVATPPPIRRIPLGLRYMAGSALFFSLMTLFVKLAGQRVPAMEIVFARSVFMVAGTYALLRRTGTPPLGHNRRLLLARGVIGATALSLFYWAIPRIPLGDATALFYVTPIWTAVAAAFVLRERTAGRVVAGMVVSLLGVALIAKPSLLFGDSAAGLDPLAVTATVTASILSGLVYTIVRKLRETDAPNVIIFYLSVAGIVLALPFAGSWVVPQGVEWLWLLGAGATTLVAQIFLTHGLHLEQAGRAMSIGYLQVVFAFVWGLFVFGNVPDGWSLGGAALIVGSVLLIARQRAAGGGSVGAPASRSPARSSAHTGMR